MSRKVGAPLFQVREKTAGRVECVASKPKEQKAETPSYTEAKRKFHRPRGNMPMSLFLKWAIGNMELRFYPTFL